MGTHMRAGVTTASTYRWSHLAVGGIVLYFLLLAATYIQAVPPFENADEAEHFIYAHHILEEHSLPVIQGRSALNVQDDVIQRWNNQAHHAPLYYLTAAVLMSWSERTDLARYLEPNPLLFVRGRVDDNANKWLHRYQSPAGDTQSALLFLRGANVLVGAGTLLLVYAVARELFTEQWPVLLSTLLVASLPTFLVVNASVSNDAPVIFLYTAGLLWSLRGWRRSRLRTRDALLIALILAGISLTKLTGLSLFGVVGVVVLWGVYQGRWSWWAAGRVLAISAVAVLLLAGWWYARNLMLYGDLLASTATATVWGEAQPLTLSNLPDTLAQIGRTFWMMVGHGLTAPDAFYAAIMLLVLLALAGHMRMGCRDTRYGLLWLVVLVVLATVLYGTLQIDISYGRLVLPAVGAIAPLLVMGWRHLMGWLAVTGVVPLLLLAMITPLVLIPQAYPTLAAVPSLPADVLPVNLRYGNFEVLGVDTAPEVVRPGDTLRVDLYMRGRNQVNPALSLTLADVEPGARLSYREVYPGMAATDRLPEGTVWRARVRLPVNPPATTQAPRVPTLVMRWIDPVTGDPLRSDGGLEALNIQPVVFRDPAYVVDAGERIVQFGTVATDVIELRGLLWPEAVQAGQEITLRMQWYVTQQPSYNWRLTLQLFDAAGQPVTQQDGLIPSYPTGRWLPGVPFEDVRRWTLPTSMPAGEYRLRMGWYRVREDGGFIRLRTGESDDMYTVPRPLRVNVP